MTRIRRVRAEIADNDSVERFAHKLGVDVFLGTGSFLSKNTVQVNGKELKFVRCIVAAGGSPRLPAIPGLAEAYKTQDFDEPRILTNENVFNLTSLPKRLGVIGAGPIGLELAQSFQRYHLLDSFVWTPLSLLRLFFALYHHTAATPFDSCVGLEHRLLCLHAAARSCQRKNKLLLTSSARR